MSWHRLTQIHLENGHKNGKGVLLHCWLIKGRASSLNGKSHTSNKNQKVVVAAVTVVVVVVVLGGSLGYNEVSVKCQGCSNSWLVYLDRSIPQLNALFHLLNTVRMQAYAGVFHGIHYTRHLLTHTERQTDSE